MEDYHKKILEIKLKEQHRNTRHDACDIITEFLQKIDELLINKLPSDESYKLFDDLDPIYTQLINSIMNMKQRSPEDVI